MYTPHSSLTGVIPAWLKRKLTAAAVSAVAVVLALIVFQNERSAAASWRELLGMGSVLLLYVTPVIYGYGVPASLLAECLLVKLLPRAWPHALASLVLHAAFGGLGMLLILPFPHAAWHGAAYAALFGLADLALSRLRAEYETSHAALSFIFLPLALFFIGVIGVNL
ncbi:hypothetical protein GXP70_03750 [Paenibacillus lycopersici]|uniref:Uncharacterized protein n=1 Tax=Paenibacillus lycopersici TaxID=2704462 RepID=A0A6C0G359_9BACL|nr:hypothetical protein [Paenibacillus lycopersici]QHT59165.1 hypothetical protein GXP70_03750 [Paenibacillus lycopersici]